MLWFVKRVISKKLFLPAAGLLGFRVEESSEELKVSFFNARNCYAFSVLLHRFAAEVSVNEEKANSIDTCFGSIVELATYAND